MWDVGNCLQKPGKKEGKTGSLGKFPIKRNGGKKEKEKLQLFLWGTCGCVCEKRSFLTPSSGENIGDEFGFFGQPPSFPFPSSSSLL